ncbi:hypothetical protein ANN_26662 [Periplaneta americana]|uniref:Uncharacterized protein n=1 Tax=Periplaneta americana TaxID=6978 RepID=A0ABQ8RYT5_PERAM|nr:hypothetical protein ANN_26662 [Periplaneta americana]
MSPGSNTECYPAFARKGLRENPGKNLNQITCPDQESNPGHLVSRPDALIVTPQRYEEEYKKFEDWCKKKKVENISEKFMLEYFSMKSEKKKSSSLWIHYSMLRCTISLKKNVDIIPRPVVLNSEHCVVIKPCLLACWARKVITGQVKSLLLFFGHHPLEVTVGQGVSEQRLAGVVVHHGSMICDVQPSSYQDLMSDNSGGCLSAERRVNRRDM